MPATAYFPDGYADGRAAFLEACGVHGVSLENHRNYSVGPDGGALWTDVAVWGPAEAASALFVNSGTHGVEGLCGSGLQTAMIREGIVARAPRDCRVVLIHAINPCGVAHLRRANEDNIDVNRNFVVHTAPYPANPHYDALADAIAPDAYWKIRTGFAGARLRLFRMRHGEAALQAALTRGQYTHPEGLFYGGTFETWSNRTLRDIVARHGAGVRRVVFIDLHTGLGPFGEGEVILDAMPGTPTHARAARWWGDMVRSAPAGESASARLTGTIDRAVVDMLPEAEVTAAALEFGTYPLPRVFRALQAENWLHNYGGFDNPRAARIKAELREALYPDSEDWRDQVWRQAEDVAERALDGLSGAAA